VASPEPIRYRLGVLAAWIGGFRADRGPPGARAPGPGPAFFLGRECPLFVASFLESDSMAYEIPPLRFGVTGITNILLVGKPRRSFGGP